jgi:geranylgeranyl diphosphate synthase type II
MDDAPLRRGNETVHEKWNINTGILSGDAMLILAYQFFEDYEPQIFQELAKLFSKTALEVCEGQQYDVDFETQPIVTHAAYIEMIRLKTSVLLAASMQIGAILGGAELKDAEAIYHYAENLGIAFQIQDDILDVYGDEKLVGKQPGGDILQNKKTLLMIEALSRSQSAGDTSLENIVTQKVLDNNEKISQVKMIFDQYDIKAYGLSIRDYYIEQALSALVQIDLTTAKKEVLLQLVNLLVKRDF